MKYSDFIEKLQNEQYPGSVVIKDGRRKHKESSGNHGIGMGDVGELELKALMEDISMPEFYKDIAELEGIDFM